MKSERAYWTGVLFVPLLKLNSLKLDVVRRVVSRSQYTLGLRFLDVRPLYGMYISVYVVVVFLCDVPQILYVFVLCRYKCDIKKHQKVYCLYLAWHFRSHRSERALCSPTGQNPPPNLF